ncbi:hypothetical protein HZA40_02955 [Candidatus Peregrinibacteria bacterium]|nr:hypothetical protein [Candidatus Peregrinibacteria bacterium]
MTSEADHINLEFRPILRKWGKITSVMPTPGFTDRSPGGVINAVDTLNGVRIVAQRPPRDRPNESVILDEDVIKAVDAIIGRIKKKCDEIAHNNPSIDFKLELPTEAEPGRLQDIRLAMALAVAADLGFGPNDLPTLDSVWHKWGLILRDPIFTKACAIHVDENYSTIISRHGIRKAIANILDPLCSEELREAFASYLNILLPRLPDTIYKDILFVRAWLAVQSVQPEKEKEQDLPPCMTAAMAARAIGLNDNLESLLKSTTERVPSLLPL